MSLPISFTPTHFTVGTTSNPTSQLFYGLSTPLPPPRPSDPDRPPSSLTFNASSRRIDFVAFCDGCEESVAGEVKKAMWPLKGEISWDSLLPRGVSLEKVEQPLPARGDPRAQIGRPLRRRGVDERSRKRRKRDLEEDLDEFSPSDDSDFSIEIISSPRPSPSSSSRNRPFPQSSSSHPPSSAAYNLRLCLRRPPHFRYTYPEQIVQFGNQDQYRVVKRHPRRSTEEDFIVLDRSKGPEGTVDPLSVVGVGGSKAFFNPGHWLTYSFELRLQPDQHSQLLSLLDIIRASSPFPLDITQPSLPLPPPPTPLPSNPSSLLAIIKPYRFETRYLIEALISHGVISTEDLAQLCTLLRRETGGGARQGVWVNQEEEVEDDDEDEIEVETTDETKEAMLIAMFGMGKISGRLEVVIDTLRAKLPPSIRPRSIPSHSVLLRRAVVTPTRLILYPPEAETSNLVLQHYPSHISRFLRVQFTDECSPLHFSDQWKDHRDRDGGRVGGGLGRWCPGRGMVGRMERVMEDGLDFGGRRWVFLAAGGSGLKERQAWFVCEDPEKGFTAEAILRWMGDFTKEKIVAKHCARIGLCFTTTRSVPAQLTITRIPDITRRSFCFTDGVGLCSQALVDRCAAELEGDGHVFAKYSAVQVRIGGIKGMLAAWPGVEGDEIRIRESMEKFRSDRVVLGAIKVSKYAPAHLNRQVILLLASVGVSPVVLLRYFQDRAAQALSLSQRALRPETVAEFKHVSFPIHRLHQAGFATEPFIRDTVDLIRSALLWDLKWKARIRVDQGVYLFGIADELNVLEENQVFCSYSGPDGVSGVVEGPCLIFRSPALHPGDVRHVTAVAHPKLIAAGVQNVIVFPTKGDRDLANQLAGGDLDGDTFTLIWNPDFIPFANCMAMNYTPSSKPLEVPEVKLDHIKTWFIDYYQNDVLGAISLAHMDIAARSTPFSDACLALAQLASDSVDYVKTGVRAKYTDDLKSQTSSKQKPDFMGGPVESKSILGQMFRLIDDASTVIRPNRSSASVRTAHRVDARLAALEVPMLLLRKAETLRREYEVDLQGVMRQYMLSELEVVTGIVAGMAVPKERRAKMMKDDGLKVSIREAYHFRIRLHLHTLVADFLSTQPTPPGFPSASHAFALAAYLVVSDSSTRTRVRKVVVGPARDAEARSGASGTEWKEEEMVSFPWLWAGELAELAELVGMGVEKNKGKGREGDGAIGDVADGEEEDEIVEVDPSPRGAVGKRKTREAVESDDEVEFLLEASSTRRGKTFGGRGNVLGRT